MAARDKDVPDMPDNWREYSRMLGDLPLRSLPPGADGRLQARLAEQIRSPRPRRPWLAGGITLVAGSLSILAGVLLFSPDDAPKPKVATRPSVVSDEKPRARAPRRQPAPRPIAPQMSETPIPVDTTPPTEIPLPHRQPDATTGGRDLRTNPAAPGAANRPRTDQRSTP